jgi:hypothetical protein
MLDSDLADLYGIAAKVLKPGSKEDIDRFPVDFMFVLTHEEVSILRSQTVTSSSPAWGGARYAQKPFSSTDYADFTDVNF